MNDSYSIYKKITKNNYCIGCGICTLLEDSPIIMKLNKFGFFESKIIKKNNNNEQIFFKKFNKTCPFSPLALDESQLAKIIFPKNFEKNKFLGKYQSNYIGYSKEGFYRKIGSSGGLISWLLVELLNSDEIDAVIHVKPVNKDEKLRKMLFTYNISYTKTQIISGAKSHYYPIELSGLKSRIRDKKIRYAFVGIPCILKGMRNLTRLDKGFSNIKYFIGIVCGHLKSSKYAEFLSYSQKINPKNIVSINFRSKIRNHPANEYAVKIKYQNSDKNYKKLKLMKNIKFSNWDLGFFKYPVCDFCDDIFNECADITFGDAWLKEEINSIGTNIIIVRNNKINQILRNGKQRNKIYLKETTEKKIIKSQKGGIRHKRDGLRYRLYYFMKRNIWVPKKRVNPSKTHISIIRRQIYKYRMILTSKSSEYFYFVKNKSDFKTFKKNIEKFYLIYQFYKKIDSVLNIIKKKINTASYMKSN